jgi:hypothetical protein
VFAARLDRAAEAAWSLAGRLVVEELPPRLVFRVRLNRSYDGNAPRPGELRFPADGAVDRAAELSSCDSATVVEELWRDGYVPQWIDVAVVDETGETTVVELICCGRFVDDDERLYHSGEGRPPFHVVSPVLPHPYDGSPFSLHRQG